jgi:L-ascorbate metabolism protein UlaG (beta-lactamase superfamily)
MVKITWFGHAAFKIEFAGKIVLVDPWLDKNPAASVKASEIMQADVVYVTHDHSDHLGDAFDICKRTNATFVATVELADFAEEQGIKNVAGLNIGGNVEIGGVKLSIVQATHTASRGAPTGVIVEGEGKSIYHAGDTGLYGDMRLLGEFHKLDVALIPIGVTTRWARRKRLRQSDCLTRKQSFQCITGLFRFLHNRLTNSPGWPKKKHQQSR